MTDIVIYVLGRDNEVDLAWENAHPRDPRSDTALAYFDYISEKRKIWKSWNGDLPPKVAADSETPISSVLDLYDFIKDAPAFSVIELHFFTHGFEGGPVLYNTYDDSTDPAKRDPKDKDPRIKDFSIDDVLGPAERLRFVSSFARSALIKLWGCTHIEKHRQLIKRDFYNRKTTDEKKATIKTIIKNFIRDDTYQYSLAKALGLPVYAAPLGWGSNPYLPFGIYGSKANDKKPRTRKVWPPKVGDRWWCVSQFFYPDRGREFYRDELGATIDILDFVAYTIDMVQE
jgi:hypothetical protein